MRIRITESQYKILVNKPRDVVFGNVNEGRGRRPKETPEEIDTKIEVIINHVRNGGEFIRDMRKDDNYKWLRSKLTTLYPEKFQNAFYQIKKIQEELENKEIERIINHVRNGGKFIRDTTKDDNYKWLRSKLSSDKTEKFQNVFYQIKKIQEELENKEIERIKNHVRNGGEFIRVTTKDDNYKWLRSKLNSDKTEKFQNVFYQIKEIQNELEDKEIERIKNHVRNGGEFIRDYAKDDNFKWLKSKSQADKTGKFKNALDQIKEIQKKLGKLREWWGERVIRDTLIGLGFENISQQGQHKYDDCKNSLTCGQYKFDIYLPYNENNYMVGKDKDFYIPKTGIIFEYDGIQHFQLNEHFGGEEGFKQRIHSDKEKNSYCQNNNIKLVRIPYTSKTRTSIQNDIVSALENTDTFILTGDYPQLGWNQQ
jgi:uncharacterized protein YjgD (DUF1641 family)